MKSIKLSLIALFIICLSHVSYSQNKVKHQTIHYNKAELLLVSKDRYFESELQIVTKVIVEVDRLQPNLKKKRKIITFFIKRDIGSDTPYDYNTDSYYGVDYKKDSIIVGDTLIRFYPKKK